MNPHRLAAWMAAGVLAAAPVGRGQTDSPVTKPGLYKGTMTISSPSYGSDKAPVSSSTPIVARVSDSIAKGEIRVVIRLKPEFDLDQPLRDFFTLDYDSNFEGYVLYQDGNGRGVVMERGPTKITVTYVGLQFSEGNVQSPYTIRIVLNRVGA